MSTTTELKVALRYGASVQGAVLLRLRVDNFMQLGADLEHLSCFPHEAEILYPPMTYLKPLGKAREVTTSDENGTLVFTVIDVQPHVGS